MNTTPSTTCEWYALCVRPAAGTVAHPAFPNGVPCCTSCAKKHELTLKLT